MLPFAPEPLAALQARYAAAVATLVDTTRVVQGLVPAPSGDRRHVFDWPDGLRLMVSRERMPDGRCGVHISASFDPACDAYQDVLEGDLDPAALLVLVVQRWSALASSARTLELLGFSERGVPHLMCWTEQ